MSEFVEGIELRVMGDLVVMKTSRAIPNRVIYALNALPVVRYARCASARRLEVMTRDWGYAESMMMPIIIHGRPQAMCPGDIGYGVTVTHMYEMRCGDWRPSKRVDVYPQYANGILWASAQQRLFGNNWMLSWLD